MNIKEHAMFRHDAFVHDSDDEFVGHMAPFLRAALDDGEAAVAVLSRGSRRRLQEALGADAARVSFIDQASHYVRPAKTIAAYDATVRHHVGLGAPSVRVVAEIPFGPMPSEWDEWLAYEAILNRALAHNPAWVVCAYDTGALPERVIEAARESHPHVLNGSREPSGRYHDPAELVRTLTPAPRSLAELETLAPSADAEELRERLARAMAAAEVPRAVVLNVLVAAGEIAANAWRHAGGLAGVRAGSVGGQFVCEITDRGGGLDDPLAGYLPPIPDQREGTGLWIVRQLVSRLELLSSPDGLTARIWA